MSLASSMTQLVESIVEMPSHFSDVAAYDPISAVLLAVGTLFVLVSVGVLGYLSLGAFASLFTGDWSQGGPPEAR